MFSRLIDKLLGRYIGYNMSIVKQTASGESIQITTNLRRNVSGEEILFEIQKITYALDARLREMNDRTLKQTEENMKKYAGSGLGQMRKIDA